MAKTHMTADILRYLDSLAQTGQDAVSAENITTQLGQKRPTVNRYLSKIQAHQKSGGVGIFFVDSHCVPATV